MAAYVITFRLKQDATYSDRWSSIVAAIKKEAVGATWDETTAFFALNSAKSADAIASSIYVGSSMDGTKDTLVVVSLSKNEFATRGEVAYPATLASILNAR